MMLGYLLAKAKFYLCNILQEIGINVHLCYTDGYAIEGEHLYGLYRLWHHFLALCL